MPSKSKRCLFGAHGFADQLRRYAETGAFDSPMTGITVDRRVDLTGTTFKKGLVLRDIHFCAELILADCKFEGPVWMDDCCLSEGLDLSQCHVEGSISITSCRFIRPAPDAALVIPALSVARSVISGNVSVVDTRITGSVSGRALRIGGDLSFAACRVTSRASNASGAVDLADCKIKGDVSFETRESKLPPQLLVYGEKCAVLKDNLRRKRSVIKAEEDKSSLNFTNACVGDSINLSNGRFDGSVILENVKCRLVSSSGDRICVKNSPENRRIEYETAIINGHLDFSDSEVGYIHLYGTQVRKAVIFIAGKSGQIYIDDFCSEDTLYVKHATIGAFYMTSWRSIDFVRCNVSRINEEDISHGYKAIEITSSTIEKELSFWPGKSTLNMIEGKYNKGKTDNFPVPDPESGLKGDRWSRHLEAKGEIRIANCKIHGDLELTGIRLTTKDTKKGRILISDTEIDGRVAFGAPASFLARSHGESLLLRDLATCHVLVLISASCLRVSSAAPPEDWASCHSLELQAVTAGDIDLRGVRVGEVGHVPHRDFRVDIVYGKIRRCVETYLRLEAAQVTAAKNALKESLGSPESYRRRLLEALLGREIGAGAGESVETHVTHVSIGGALNLQYSEVGQLKVSDELFKGNSGHENPHDTGLVLDFAKIRNLTVALVKKTATKNKQIHNGFPKLISLHEVQVDAWFLEPLHLEPKFKWTESEPTNAALYLDLLDNDPEFRMSSYTAVERSLRNRGLDKEADRIYIAAHFRDARTEKKPDKKPRSPTWHANAWRRMRLWPWRKGDGRYREERWLKGFPLFRLKRNPCETAFGLSLFVIWSMGFAFATWLILHDWSGLFGSERLLGAIILFVILGVLAPFSLRIFIDRLYWSLLDYGTGATHLAGIIFLLMLVSFVFVSGERRNFEPTIRAQTLGALQARSGIYLLSRTLEARSPAEEEEHPTAEGWTLGERLWMTLQYHVPLVPVVVAEEWQASRSPLRITRPFVAQANDERCVRSRSHDVEEWLPGCEPVARGFCLKARDWFGAMEWLNWILWPLFLPFLIRKLRRDR
ncbi:hypothetical protein M3I53_36065 [Paraburkholderia sp. CNPSo 3272]|uniref:hypothetical protein n=1 Tax=Paraburkholderia sp. CNPSo 3272 TaxID=2940931 RepID=UPI0020B8E7A7|nr:hypothetical protein [Paraburkholderia sp. CNPSo 3272]MCP3728463.1 hypothetical protein [Paraburkholderia sp. CNPSo 3272]